MNAQTAHTPVPWREHDMESDAIVGPDRKAIALVMGRSRTPEEDAANLKFICEAVNSHALLVEHNEQLRSLLSQMLDAAENADETGYVTDLGFIDLDKLYATARAALNPSPTK